MNIILWGLVMIVCLIVFIYLITRRFGMIIFTGALSIFGTIMVFTEGLPESHESRVGYFMLVAFFVISIWFDLHEGKDGVSRGKWAFRYKAKDCGLKVSDYGRVINYSGDEYKLIGITSWNNNPSCVILQRVSDHEEINLNAHYIKDYIDVKLE